MEVRLIVRPGHHPAQLVQHLRVHRAAPLQLVLPCLDHIPQLGPLRHPVREGGLVAGAAVLQRVLGKADCEEVALDEVDDHLPVGELAVFRRHVVLPLGLDDAFAKVLDVR